MRDTAVIVLTALLYCLPPLTIPPDLQHPQGPPYNQLHNGYIKRYLATQKPTILDVAQRLEGKHKQGHLFQISITVSKIESGADVNFMARDFRSFFCV